MWHVTLKTDAENSASITEINYILKYIQIENVSGYLQITHVLMSREQDAA